MSTRLVPAALAACLSAAAAAQDTTFCITPTGNGNTWQITATLNTAPSADGISSVWADASFDLSSFDGNFDNLQFNAGYAQSAFGAPQVTGEGSGNVQVRNATMPGGTIFISEFNDDSNPLLVLTFDYSGTAGALDFSLVGQNSIAFVDNANPLFGAVEFYQDAQGNPGSRSFGICIPAPSSAGLLGIASLAAARRRR